MRTGMDKVEKLKQRQKIRSATSKVILNTSKTLANGEHPIAIRITKDRNRTVRTLDQMRCRPEWWNKRKEEPSLKHPQRSDIFATLSDYDNLFKNAIKDLNETGKDYTVHDVYNRAFEPVRDISVDDYFDRRIKILREDGKRKYAKTFNDTRQQLYSFCKEENLKFEELKFQNIDVKLLKSWKSWMVDKPMKQTSMSVFFRTLRTLYNNAIEAGVINNDQYPFKDFKISKFQTTTKKRAISKDEMVSVIVYPTEAGSKLRDAQNIFVFSYLNRGINFIDIAKLQWKNISSQNLLEYKRSKTGKDFSFKMNDLAIQILKDYRKISDHDPENFVFPVLYKERHITPVQIENRIHKVLGEVNKNLKLIGSELGIEKPLTTYVARHSFATVMKRNGTSMSMISEAMGHESESITRIYLDAFEGDAIYEASKGLI